jgi:hypothetical protein
VCTRDSDYSAAPGSNGFYEIIDADIQARIRRFASELLLFAEHMRHLRAADSPD